MTAATATFIPTEAQAKLLNDLIDERFEGATNANWKHHLRGIDSFSRFQDAYQVLKSTPKLVKVEERPALVATATEEGVYRDPATGKLYRVKKSGWEWTVQEYSISATAKRVTVDGEVQKKGTWKRHSAFTARIWLSPRTFGFHILAEWLTTPAELVEYQYNFCSYCFRGLKDAESVLRNYGPDCAKQHGLPYGNAHKALPVREG